MTMTEQQPQLDPDLIQLAIDNGLCDENLDAIIDAARARRDVVQSRNALSLNSGDEFYLINISPKYLAGKRVRLHRFDGQWLICSWVSPKPDRYSSTVKLRHSHVGRIVRKEGI